MAKFFLSDKSQSIWRNCESENAAQLIVENKEYLNSCDTKDAQLSLQWLSLCIDKFGSFAQQDELRNLIKPDLAQKRNFRSVPL